MNIFLACVRACVTCSYALRWLNIYGKIHHDLISRCPLVGAGWLSSEAGDNEPKGGVRVGRLRKNEASERRWSFVTAERMNGSVHDSIILRARRWVRCSALWIVVFRGKIVKFGDFVIICRVAQWLAVGLCGLHVPSSRKVICNDYSIIFFFPFLI